MIYLRSRGGEDLLVAVDRAINLAVHSTDIVHLIYNGVAIDVHPTWRETAAHMWRELYNNRKLQEPK
jgi:hypothetical protein